MNEDFRLAHETTVDHHEAAIAKFLNTFSVVTLIKTGLGPLGRKRVPHVKSSFVLSSRGRTLGKEWTKSQPKSGSKCGRGRVAAEGCSSTRA
jgi:hypothetical protein